MVKLSVTWKWWNQKNTWIRKIEKLLNISHKNLIPKNSYKKPNLGIIIFNADGKQIDLIYYGNKESDNIVFNEVAQEFIFNQGPTELSLLVLFSEEDLGYFRSISVTCGDKIINYSYNKELWTGKGSIILGAFTINETFTPYLNLLYKENCITDIILRIERILVKNK